jgi:hypothetical protein
MAPPALQKALGDTVNFEAVIQTASVLTLCGKISKVIELLRIRSDVETPPAVVSLPPITTLLFLFFGNFCFFWELVIF